MLYTGIAPEKNYWMGADGFTWWVGQVQADGGRLFDSPTDVTTCNHFGGRTVDHASIHDAQVYNDLPRFKELYSKKGIASTRICIPLDNWEQSPSHWQRRFKGTTPQTYNDLLALND